MMDADELSSLLFGRHQALRVYVSIARLSKPAFTTGQLHQVSEVPSPVISKELARLVGLGLVRPTSRRGDYERTDGGETFWQLIDHLATAWDL